MVVHAGSPDNIREVKLDVYSKRQTAKIKTSKQIQNKFKTSMARVPYNKLLTNLASSSRTGPGLALGRFCADLTTFGPYFHDPRRLVYSKMAAILVFFCLLAN